MEFITHVFATLHFAFVVFFFFFVMAPAKYIPV